MIASNTANKNEITKNLNENIDKIFKNLTTIIKNNLKFNDKLILVFKIKF